MLEQEAWRSPQVQAMLARLAWARRLRRLTPLPWPISQGLREPANNCASGVQLVANFSTASRNSSSLLGGRATPTSRPRLVFVAEVRCCASYPFGRRLSSPSSVHDHVVERAVEDGAGKSRALACVWMQLLKLWKTARSQGCKYDVLFGGMKHSDVRELRRLGGHGAIAGMDAGHVPEKDSRLSFLVQGSSRRLEWPRAAGLWSSLPSRSPT